MLSRLGAETPEQAFARASKYLPFWVSLLLVVLIGYYLSRIVWLVFPGGGELEWAPPPATTRAQSGAGGAGGAKDYQPLVDAHLFGTSSQAPVPPPVAETIDAPETRLNLKLRGTVTATDTQTAHAIIADGSGKEKVYFINDAVPGGATLHQVQPDRVILNRGGILEALKLPHESAGPPRGRPRSVGRTTGAPSVQEVITKNVAAFTDVVRLQPFAPKGKLKGYRIYPGPKRRYFTSLGLKPGDLVTEINGTTLDNPAKGAQVFQSLGNSTQVTLTVERNGSPQTITLDTSQLDKLGGDTR